jgi:murein DD-endopeptidase MepM/ murein hydrolase activator NlpD
LYFVCPRGVASVFWNCPAEEESLFKALMWSGVAAATVAGVACASSDAASNASGVVASQTPVAALPSPGSPATSPSVTATPSAAALTGFSYPLAGACLPRGDQLMPNAPRPYRNGIHEGVDFYDADNCTRITKGTEVLAARTGRVVRADLEYRDLTSAQMSQFLANPNTEEALDAFRGRQVWIEHDGGTITRYAHLSGISPGILVGATVRRGQVVAYVGESGTPESITNPGHEYHLHFEVRTAYGYLGKDLPPADVRELYLKLFTQAQ